jgi:hypothetical protein
MKKKLYRKRNDSKNTTNLSEHIIFTQNNVTLLGGRLEGRSSHEPCLPCGATGTCFLALYMFTVMLQGDGHF